MRSHGYTLSLWIWTLRAKLIKWVLKLSTLELQEWNTQLSNACSASRVGVRQVPTVVLSAALTPISKRWEQQWNFLFASSVRLVSIRSLVLWETVPASQWGHARRVISKLNLDNAIHKAQWQAEMLLMIGLSLLCAILKLKTLLNYLKMLAFCLVEAVKEDSTLIKGLKNVINIVQRGPIHLLKNTVM